MIISYKNNFEENFFIFTYFNVLLIFHCARTSLVKLTPFLFFILFYNFKKVTRAKKQLSDADETKKYAKIKIAESCFQYKIFLFSDFQRS